MLDRNCQQQSPTKHKAKRSTGQGQRSVNIDALHCKRHETSRKALILQSDCFPSIFSLFYFIDLPSNHKCESTFSTAGTSIHLPPTPIRLTCSCTQFCSVASVLKLLCEMFQVRLQDRLYRKLLQGFQWLESALSFSCVIHLSCTHLAALAPFRIVHVMLLSRETRTALQGKELYVKRVITKVHCHHRGAIN